jgi:hypothetical protein
LQTKLLITDFQENYYKNDSNLGSPSGSGFPLLSIFKEIDENGLFEHPVHPQKTAEQIPARGDER